MGQETFERDGITVFGGRMDATNALVLVFFEFGRGPTGTCFCRLVIRNVNDCPFKIKKTRHAAADEREWRA